MTATGIPEIQSINLPDRTQLPESDGIFVKLPDHTQLPESDGTFVKNFQEHPQSILLSTSIEPVLQQRHPDGQYCIGQDSGIYWRIADPPEKGAEAPDWFCVLGVSPGLKGKMRRSYVLWQELIPPLIVLEFASGDGFEEREITPWEGKFWIYEKVIRPPFYGIYEVKRSRVEVYHLIEDRYELVSANNRGHYPISTLGVELGIWQGRFMNMELPWLRWWDDRGNLLLSGDERSSLAEQQLQQTELLLEQERQAKDFAQQKADRLAERLRSMGIDPDE